MKKLIAILIVFCSLRCEAQTVWEDIAGKTANETPVTFNTYTTDDSEFIQTIRAEELAFVRLTIAGLKEIRHDALCRLRFNYARSIELEIKKEDQLLR